MAGPVAERSSRPGRRAVICRYVLGASVACLSLLGLSCGSEARVVPQVPPPPPPCNLETDAQVSSPAPDSQADKDLKRAQVDSPANAFSDEQRTMLCRQQWQDIVETTYCSQHIAEFCIRSCETDADEQACLVPPRSELVMQKCRQQSLAWFAGIYTGCEGFHLCGNKLEPSKVTCPAH
jgi:hypothetical protein